MAELQSYLTSEVPTGVRVYLPHEADAAPAAKDAEIARLKLELEASRADVNWLGLTVVNISEIVEQTDHRGSFRPEGHHRIEMLCNAAFPIATQQGFQGCNIPGCTSLTVAGTGRCFDHHPRTEHSNNIRELLHTAFSGIKGGFKLPDWWLPKVRAALSDKPIPGYDEAMELAKSDPLPSFSSEIERYKRAVEWCLEKGAVFDGDVVCNRWRERIEAPADIADIINAAAGAK